MDRILKDFFSKFKSDERSRVIEAVVGSYHSLGLIDNNDYAALTKMREKIGSSSSKLSRFLRTELDEYTKKAIKTLLNARVEELSNDTKFRCRILALDGQLYEKDSDKFSRKNLHYRGFKCIQEDLQSVARSAHDMIERCDSRLGYRIGVVTICIRQVLGRRVPLIGMICSELCRLPTLSMKLKSYIKSLSEEMSLLKEAADYFMSGSSNSRTEVERYINRIPAVDCELARIDKDIQLMFDKVYSIEGTLDSLSKDGTICIADFKIKREELGKPEVLREHLTSKAICALPALGPPVHVEKEVIARGVYSEVRKGRIAYGPGGGSERVVAIKKIEIKYLNNEQSWCWRRPLRVLREAYINKLAGPSVPGANSEFILTLLGVIIPDNEDDLPYLVMDYADGGDLRAYSSTNDSPFSLQDRLEKAHEIARGLQHLHSLEMPIVHGDLTPANVVIVGGKARISDFGLSRQERRGTGCTTGTKERFADYRAPEISYNTVEVVSCAADVYSYGCLFLELLTGIRLEKYIEKTKTAVMGRHGSPLHATSASDSLDGLRLVTPKLFGSNPETQTDFPPVYVSLLERCFEFHAEDRLSASELENGVKMLISITT